ncbi:hypothetical protein M3Y99_00458500 [Aphelenchoides fujianensis]|nr:hypothetical protein M3Y99_00458500 [Aphelenchoides fujianensis]
MGVVAAAVNEDPPAFSAPERDDHSGAAPRSPCCTSTRRSSPAAHSAEEQRVLLERAARGHPLHVLLVRNGPRRFAFDNEELADVLERAAGVCAAESSLLEVPVPTHGAEVAHLKLQFAGRVHVVQGDHEESINSVHSFYDEAARAPAARRVGGRPRAGGRSPKRRSLAAVRPLRRLADFAVGSLKCARRRRLPVELRARQRAASTSSPATIRLRCTATRRSPAPGYESSSSKDVKMGACLEIAADCASPSSSSR